MDTISKRRIRGEEGLLYLINEKHQYYSIDLGSVNLRPYSRSRKEWTKTFDSSTHIMSVMLSWEDGLWRRLKHRTHSLCASDTI